MGLIPREEAFFDLFEKLSEKLQTAARLLVDTTEHFDHLNDNAMRMERLEHDGDQVVHEIMARLSRTFITPLDREDIHRLASALDDVLDFIEATTEHFVIYKIREATPPARELAQVIAKQVEEIASMIAQLRKLEHKNISQHCIEINRLENQGDRILRGALADLFNNHNGASPLEVLKWRDLYEIMEAATDKGEDVADVFESIALKNA
ncbi:MAG: DUF47 family protein [Bryobacterales bacterium]|nr:DUF47 family protein [Bryobacteraceae bacterium]MDW8354423.1 DUF47 family protein [Bryobacterales bacterium]